MFGDVCFGCGQNNQHGLQIRSYWDNDQSVCVWTADKRHQGWPSLTCGGIIATLIDCHCMATAMATAVKNENRPLGSNPSYRFATGTLKVKYLKPTPVDVPITLKAWVTNIKDQRIYTLRCQVEVKAQLTAEAEVIAFLVYRSDQTDDEHQAFDRA